MKPAKRYDSATEKAIITRCLDFADDPQGFMEWMYPWGQPNTPLAKFKGPHGWQAEVNAEIKHQIARNKALMELDLPPELFQEGIASGRGIGKSAEFGMLSHWMVSCHFGATVTVTANTQQQLKSKTFPEIKRWFAMGLNAHWFEMQTLDIDYKPWFAEMLRDELKIDPSYSGVHHQLWDEENPDSFAGTHNPLGLMLLMDEASGIPTSIFDASYGFFTELSPYRFWKAFGNPRRTTGGFYDIFHMPGPWRLRHIDARTVPGDHAVLQQIIDKYGEDSDQARVEVKGQFPRAGQDQYIPTQDVKDAQQRVVEEDRGAPLIAGGDPARHGSNDAVLRWRMGRDARNVPPPLRRNGLNNVELADAWAAEFDKHKPDGIFIDAGNGTGVIDILRDRGYKVNEVWFGSASTDPQYHDKRSQIWGEMGEWMKTGAIDPADGKLERDLTSPLDVGLGTDVKQLESKKALRKRGIDGLDDGDALACTFAGKVSRKDSQHSRHPQKSRVVKGTHYNPLARRP